VTEKQIKLNKGSSYCDPSEV